MLPELIPLLGTHYQALSLHKGRHELRPQYHVYLDREDKGELLLVTVRRDGVIVGYWITFVAPGLHYETCLTGTMDIWFIHPEHIVGKVPVLLLKTVERELKRRGVNLWFAGSKDKNPCGPFLERNGFERVETYYAKWLEA